MKPRLTGALAVAALTLSLGAFLPSVTTAATAAQRPAATSAAQPRLAPWNVDAWDLVHHKYAVAVQSTVRMWDCWTLAGSGTPRLQARAAGRWTHVITATMSRDNKRCGASYLKATYTWTVRWAGTREAATQLNLLRVREVVADQSIPWSIVVRRSPGSRPSGTVHGITAGAFCAELGAYGYTSTGHFMQCKTSATDSRFRWRSV